MNAAPPILSAGPRRLILIQSGKYDYAELDLTRSFQLVGVNGLGKTALISTLQYLYIDSQKEMRFGQHSTDDSRRFYFKADSSYILYECETTLGLVTLGVRSLGPTSGYDLQRFAWTGGYQRSDFLDEKGRPRSWDDVRPALGIKGLQIVTDNAELRGLLGAVDVETKTSWGLVPLADARDYPRFRQTFRRLLQLQTIKQDDLKQLLADCAKLGPSQREIDLAKDFEKDLGKITRDRAEIERLRKAAPLVKTVRTLADQERVARTIAHAVAKEIQDRHAAYVANFNSIADSLYKVRDAAAKEHMRLETEQETLQKNQTEAAGAAGIVRDKLAKLTQAKERFASFILEIEEQARDQLGSEIAELRSRLADVPKETVETLRSQLTDKENLLTQKKAAATRLSELFITWIRERMPEKDIASLGALFDRRILESVMNEDVQVFSEKELLRRLALAAEACDARGYTDETVSITFPPGALSTPGKIGHVEKLQEEIRELERDAARLRKNIETLQNTRLLRAQLATLNGKYSEKIKQILEYQNHLEELEKQEADEHELKYQEGEVARLQALLKNNETDRNKAKVEGQTAIDKFTELQTNDTEIRREARNLPAAEGENPGATPVSDATIKELPESLLEAIKITRTRCGEARSLSQQISDKITVLDRDFLNPTFLYDTAAPIETRLTQLETEIASIPARTEDIENRWRSVLISARNSFHTILKSLDEVTKQARKLTGELAKIEFSSLAEVRLEIIRDPAAVNEYERYSKDAAQPSLFDTAEEADQKLAQFNQLLQRRPRLILNELFSLRCEVRRNDGQKNSYDDFDQVESTGTTIVLKVTLNLLVLRDLLIPDKARIPYYLDEVHALDRQNFNNIMQLSERLGFVGIYAAPTAAVGPRRFIHLVPDAKGHLVVTATHQKDIVRTPEEKPEHYE